jgi:aminopeptidase N
MMTVLAGPERFRAGTDLYFERHDGEAATCEDFVTAIEDGAQIDLAQFRRWYEQAGTPRVDVAMSHDPVTAGDARPQADRAAHAGPERQAADGHPAAHALFDRQSGTHGGEHLIVLTKGSSSSRSRAMPGPGALDQPRLFRAGGDQRPQTVEDLVFLAAHDDDPFARYEAMQQLVVQHLVAAVEGRLDDDAREAGRKAIAGALARSWPMPGSTT